MAEPDRIPTLSPFDPLFRPRSIVFLGATPDVNKLGGMAFWNLAQKFTGAIYPINPKYADIMGVKTLSSASELPEAPDLALVMVPASSVVAELDALAAKGTKAALIFTSGFSEVGGSGIGEQAKLVALARRSGMRILGPNCMGFFNVQDHVYATFSPAFRIGWPKLGPLGVVSQSGAVGAYLFALGRERGLGFSHWITSGNQCDIEFADGIDFLADDSGTSVIMGYLEGATNGPKLRTVLEKARAAKKPVIILKVGRSERGAEAAQSHTASLVGSDAVYAAVFREAGVHRAQTVEELLDVAEAATLGQRPANRKLGIVTISGGAAILMADAASEVGLELPELPAHTQAEFKKLVPFAGTRNPLDTTAQILTDFGLLRRSIDMMVRDGGCGAVAVFVAAMGLNPEMSQKMLTALEGLSGRSSGAVIAFSIVARPDVRVALRNAGFIVVEDPDHTIRVLAALTQLEEAFARPAKPDSIFIPAMSRASDYGSLLAAGVLDEYKAKQLLAAAGVPTVPERLAHSAEEAVSAAREIGFPVAMKIISPYITHKSEIGGVLLNIATPEAARNGYATLVQRALEAAPTAQIASVLVATMIQDGVETILGVRNDPMFGPIVMFGLGGIFVEILGDVALRLAPIDAHEARAMIREVKGYPLLAGTRGRPKADEEVLIQALVALSQFAARHGQELDSIEVNPFIALPVGGFAVDALIVKRNSGKAKLQS
jgi:acyl-CoA synthetase (NDP forming)